MGLLKSLSPRGVAPAAPRAAGDVGESIDLTDPRLVEFLRGGLTSESGAMFTPEGAMRVTTAYRCANILASAVKSMPLDFKRRVDPKKRIDADDHPLWNVLQVKPNSWQTPSEFKSMMQLSVLLRGNGYALKVRSLGKIKSLIPLMPGSVQVSQNADLSLKYVYTSKAGGTVDLTQDDIFHLRGMSIDGVRGLSVIGYAAEEIGLSIQAQKYAAKIFKNGAVPGGVLKHPKSLTDPEVARLKASLEEFRGADNAQKLLLLEDGLEYARIAMTSVDAQLLQIMELTQYDIAMRFGVPPHLIGLTSKTTSWGSGIEQIGSAFVAYTLQDYLTMWAESIRRDLLGDADPTVYVRFNPAGLIRGDIKTRYAAYAVGRQWGWLSVNDIREKEDMDPVEGGDIYLQPTNMVPAGSDAAAAMAAMLGHNGGPPLDDPSEDPTKP
ncbi:HK97 family phage portal protein [Bradyrhizobium elkanii]|uniref:phage portal protein n=1 Tax=Bradyrhizobium elkanii TaxID=29448 RepID=UPI00092326D9|nr:phage portal protein [Bradyrhizobium elkanii]MCW2195045.1 HK97 family phage portal protein [Bradyrhizobium elkanii]NWL67260.1 phage portal protein [Bradyrhizobium elkanii]OIM91631.1 phage portal protein [Bradyrhizobium elkanii]